MPTDAGWVELLDRIEWSIADAECGAAAHPVDLHDAAYGEPMPAALQERAEALMRRAARLEASLGAQLDEIDTELGRHSPRRRPGGPPAPSHLDHLA